MYEANKKRPILVKMHQYNEVSNVLMQWNLISNPYTVSFHLTPYQREQLKILINEADTYNAKHDISKGKNVVRFVRAIQRFLRLTSTRKIRKVINLKIIKKRDESTGRKIIIYYKNVRGLRTKFNLVKNNIKLLTPEPDVVILTKT